MKIIFAALAGMLVIIVGLLAAPKSTAPHRINGVISDIRTSDVHRASDVKIMPSQPRQERREAPLPNITTSQVVNNNTISDVIMVPPPPSQPPPAIAKPIPPEPPPQLPAETPINLRTVVVLKCSFVRSGTEARLKTYGSGIIISRDGHILTARHVTDLQYAYEITGGRQGANGYQLEFCDVGQPPEGTRTPTPGEIRAINSFTKIDFFPYRAQVAFIPDETSMSDAEKQFLDVALLRIISTTDDARYFGVNALPASFDFSRALASQAPQERDEIITFGFPSGAPHYGSEFYLQGSVGEAQGIIVGDQKFKNKPIGIAALMETIGGRSGSPVFWRGNVVAVVSSKEDYTKNSTSVSVIPLLQMLQSQSIEIPFQ